MTVKTLLNYSFCKQGRVVTTALFTVTVEGETYFQNVNRRLSPLTSRQNLLHTFGIQFKITFKNEYFVGIF